MERERKRDHHPATLTLTVEEDRERASPSHPYLNGRRRKRERERDHHPTTLTFTERENNPVTVTFTEREMTTFVNLGALQQRRVGERIGMSAALGCPIGRPPTTKEN